MKTLMLTGIANEVDFSDEEGVSSFFLVFNRGEFRLSVTEDTASYAMQAMAGENTQSIPLEEPAQHVAIDENREEQEIPLSSGEGAEIFGGDGDYGQPPIPEADEVEDGVGQF